MNRNLKQAQQRQKDQDRSRSRRLTSSLGAVSPFSAWALARTTVFIAVLLLVNKAGRPGNLAFLGAAAILTFVGSNGALKAFSLVSLAPLLNTAFVENSGTVYTVGRFALFALISARLLWQLFGLNGVSLISNATLWLGVFCGVCLVGAKINNYYFQVSVAKLASFGVAMVSVLVAFTVCRNKNEDLIAWFYCLFVFIAGLGVIAWRLGLGYNAKAEVGEAMGLFNGPLYHSNALGPLAAMIVVQLVCLIFYDRTPDRWFTVSIAGVFLIFLIMSKSRTGVAALICGLGTFFASKFLMEAAFCRRIVFSIRPVTVAFAFAGIVAAALGYDMTHEGKLGGFVKSFVMKGGGGNGISDFNSAGLVASRAEPIQYEWSNFKAKPWTGIGFGTSTASYFIENVSAFSAPTEKGCLPVGVLEETGIFGGLCFIIFVASMFQQLFSQASLAGVALLATYLAVNMGEDMFFSFGGHGAFGWALVVAGAALGAPFFEAERALRQTNRPEVS